MQEPVCNIVVVDDDTGMNEAMERLLNAAGFAAITFPSGEALLESGAAAHAACLILDVHLSGLSGFELYERLKQAGRKAPVIFITAYDDAASKAHFRAAGAAAYLIKPFSGQKLLDCITQTIRYGAASEGYES